MDKNQYIEKTLFAYSDGISRNFQLFGKEIFPELSKEDLTEILGIMIYDKLLQKEEKLPGVYKLGEIGRSILSEGGWINYQNIRNEHIINVWKKNSNRITKNKEKQKMKLNWVNLKEINFNLDAQ